METSIWRNLSRGRLRRRKQTAGYLYYYMSEPVVKDDAKGVGPFLIAYYRDASPEKIARHFEHCHCKTAHSTNQYEGSR